MNPTSQVDPIAAQLGGRVVKAEPDAPLPVEVKTPALDPIAAQLGGKFVPVATAKAAATPLPPAAAVDPLAQQLGGKLVSQNAPTQPQITSNAKPGTEAYFLDAVAQQLGGRVASTIPPMKEAITPSVMNKHAKQAYVTGSAQVLGSMGALIEGATPFTETGQHIREFAKSMETPMPGWENVDLKDPLAIADKIGTDIITQVPQMGATIAAGAGAGTVGALGVAWIMNAGETFNNLRELGVDRNSARLAAAGGGTIKAAFDSVLPMKILGKMKFLPADIPGKTASGFMAFLAPLIKDAGLEAGTEATQELVDIALEKYYGVSKETLGTALARLGNVAASAAVTGGAFGALEHVVGGATAVPPQSDNEPPPSITPDDPTQPPPPPPSPAPTVAPEVPRTHAVPGPPTMDEVTAQIRSRVVARGGEAAIYGKKTPDDIRNLLGVRSDAPMEKLQELGLISPEADGTYKFTELVTGGMNFQPMPLHPGWVKSTDPTNVEYKYTTPGGPTFDVGFVPKEGNPEEGTFSTVLNGELISAPTMAGLREQIDTATGEGPQAIITESKESTELDNSTFTPTLNSVQVSSPTLAGLQDQTTIATNASLQTISTTPRIQDVNKISSSPRYSLEQQKTDIFVPTEENFELAFPGTQTTEVQTNTGQKLWQLDMPNGQRVLVSPEKGYIAVDLEKASEDYGETLDPESTVAVGKFYMIGQEGRIELAREGAGQDTLAEEAFHAAMQMALTEAERDTVIRGYGSEEKAAKAYVKLTADSPTNRFFRKIRDMFQRFSDIFAGQTPRTILNAISRGDVWTRMENTPEATIRGNNKPALKEMAALKKLFRNTPAGPKNVILGSVSKYFNSTRAITTLLQMGYMNPVVTQLQDYIKAVRTQYWMTKMDLLTEADDVLRLWGKVGWKVQQLTDKLIREVEHDSIKKDRRLSTQEIIAHAQQIDKDSQGKNVPKMLQIWAMQDASMQTMLDKLENAMVQELHRIWNDPMLAALHAADIQAAFNEMRKINYFPGTRFGKYGLQIKAAKAITYQGEKYRKGEIIIFETFEKRAHADKAFVEAQKKFQGIGEVMQKPVLDTTGALLSFPPAVTSFLEKHLNLSPQQVSELKEIQAAFSPGRGAMKHFIQKKGIRGASMDTMRVYADYAQHMSNHIAKIVSRYDMEQAIDSLRKETQTGQHVIGTDPVTGKPITVPISDALDKGHMVSVLESHYKDLLNPGNEFGALRGFVFLLYFGFYVKAAAVNLTQVPIFTWDYLTKRSEGNAARLAISKSYIEVLSANMRGGLQNTVSAADFQMLERGNREGFINESTASEVGAISSGSLMSSYFEKSRFAEYYMRRALQNSVAMHKATEVLNRRVTFLAALKVGRSRGLVGEALYQFAVKAVDMTQFEYSRWNKPSIMRGKTAPLFLFKQYQQHQLYYEASMEAGWRHYLALAAIGGLKGLPLWTELAALLGLTVSGVKKHLDAKNPKFDLEVEARKLVETFGGNPDLLMNGASRYGFGLSLLNYFGGLPIPALDFSSSVQMNKVIPGLAPLAQMAEGIKDKKTGMLEILADTLGAGSQTGMNLSTALTEDGPTAARKLLSLSRFMKDAMRAFDMIQSKGYRNQKGEKLVDVDMQNPSHIMEVVAQSMGVAPSRVSREYSARSFEIETKAYYLGWRENIINAWALALMNNRDALPDVKKNYQQFMKQAPKEYWMSANEIRQSLVERMQKAKLHELGLPQQKRYWQLHQDAMKLYQTKPERPTPPLPTP